MLFLSTCFLEDFLFDGVLMGVFVCVMTGGEIVLRFLPCPEVAASSSESSADSAPRYSSESDAAELPSMSSRPGLCIDLLDMLYFTAAC